MSKTCPFKPINPDHNYIGHCPYCSIRKTGLLFDEVVHDLKEHMLSMHKPELNRQFKDSLTGAAIKATHSVLQGGL